jgi:ADP-heptose synthase, bifunctional sugar kinase/adenylyltransferase
MEIFKEFGAARLHEIISNIRNVHIALIGDLCLDVYWKADMTRSELSRETPHYPLPVVEERMSPGAGGNVAANISALKPGSTKILGVIGKDWRGDVLSSKLKEYDVDTRDIVVSNKAITNAYCKPLRKGISHVEYEDPRIDFLNYEQLPKQDEEELLYRLERCIGSIDILCVSDQLPIGCITPVIREKILYYARQGLKVVVDSRDRIGLYRGVILKPNEIEGYRAVHKDSNPSNAVFEDYVETAKSLVSMYESEVCMTLGAQGCLYADPSTVFHIPAVDVTPPIDICGAGDTFLSAFSCALASEATPVEAAYFANIAAEVTIKKTGITGTATTEEIIKRYINSR